METLYSSKPLQPEELKEIIKFFDTSTFNEENKYYESQNTGIVEHVNELIAAAANAKRPKLNYEVYQSSFYKKVCNQSANYLVGDDVTISGLKDKPVLDINKFIQPLSIQAAKNGRAWVHFYVNQDKLRFKIMDNTEIIPVYDTEYEEILRYIIRFYSLQDGLTQRTRVEVWDSEKVTYYLEDKNGDLYLDYLTSQEPVQPHFTTVYSLMGQPTETEVHSWGRPPFFELKYNLERKSELGAIKKWIDGYDKVVSGFVDNVNDIREAILLIKDRAGDALSELMEKIDKYRALFVEDTGDATYLTGEIPVQAREILKKEFRACIYEFSDSVDMASFESGGNITNVYIEAMFQSLDSKSRGFSKMVDDFILEVLEAFNVYRGIKSMPIENLDDLEITYNKTIPSNIVERIKAVNESKGVISDETIYEVHPLVKDAVKEKERVDAEKLELIDDMNQGGAFNEYPSGNTRDISDNGSENDNGPGSTREPEE